MKEETIAVEFVGTYPLEVAGTIHVPKSVWENKDDGDLWGLAAEKYVKEWIDPVIHGTGFVDESNIEISHCFPAKAEGDGGI